MQDLQDQFDLTYLFISHDLVVRYMCDEVALLYLGKIVEVSDTEVDVSVQALRSSTSCKICKTSST